ncbi:MAG: hypothetical protein HY259_05030 [Chloroflexi bacterium]|nr:hypothetical protein [Chloroflexota bacterium]
MERIGELLRNRTTIFAFFGVLAIICLGAYIAVSTLVEGSNAVAAPTVAAPTSTPTAVSAEPALAPTPTNTRVVVGISAAAPTAVTPPATTAQPARASPTLFTTPTATPRSTASSTATAGAPGAPTATRKPTSTLRPTATRAPTLTPTPAFAYRVDSGPAVDTSRTCIGQYYIYGTVLDNQNQPLSGLRIGYTNTWGLQSAPAVTEQKGYELTLGTQDITWSITVLDAGGNALSPTVQVTTAGLASGKCWFKLSFRKN